MISTVAFWIIAGVTLLSAVFVVKSRNLVHAVMWLALSLLGTAGLYALMDAPFLSGIQVLTYVGGIVTLMIFGVMITRRHDGSTIEAGGTKQLRAALAALGLFGVLFAAVWKTDLSAGGDLPPATTTRELAHALLDENLFAFEVASLLLLAAIIGAIVLVRRRDPEQGAEREPTAVDQVQSRRGTGA